MTGPAGPATDQLSNVKINGRPVVFNYPDYEKWNFWMCFLSATWKNKYLYFAMHYLMQWWSSGKLLSNLTRDRLYPVAHDLGASGVFRESIPGIFRSSVDVRLSSWPSKSSAYVGVMKFTSSGLVCLCLCSQRLARAISNFRWQLPLR